MAGKKITELGSKSGLISNHKTVVADTNGIAYQVDYLGTTTGVTWNGINTATFNRNDGNSYNLEINSFSANTISGTTIYSNGTILTPSNLRFWNTFFDGNNASTSANLPTNTFVVVTGGNGGVSLPYRPPGNTVVYISNVSGNSGLIYGNQFGESVILNGTWNSTISSTTFNDGIQIKFTFIVSNINNGAGFWFPESFSYFSF